MNIQIIIPCYNEAHLIEKTLDSLLQQTYPANHICVVNDNSTDNSASIIKAYANRYTNIDLVNNTSSPSHAPGSKVIEAFNKGLATVNQDFDIICKFDADLIFPENYLEQIVFCFRESKNIGIAGGFCYIQKNNSWVLENLTNKDHVRGALKAYRKECFTDIGGLKTAMGWDTVDELLAQYHGWSIATITDLKVKHLKPTGNTYSKKAKYKQGAAFYCLRYGVLLTSIASIKLAIRKRNITLFFDYIRGYFRAKQEKKTFLVSPKEGVFIRSLRWKGIKSKIFNT